ncbi:MAG: flagellar biosynthesis protein FlhF [Thermanaerothrix sp.]|nr:flagellar biosynthesis protein FlhF [Thermanaerothrix sp.]
MRVLKQIEFEARDDAEAMRIASKRLGRDAVILSSRPVKKGGFLGLFGKRVLIVTAGILEDDSQGIDQESRQRLFSFQQLLDMRKEVHRAVMGPEEDQPVNPQPQGVPVAPLNYVAASQAERAYAAAAPAPVAPGTKLEEQVEELRRTLDQVLRRVGSGGGYCGDDPMVRRLVEADVDPGVASKIIEGHRGADVSLEELLSSRIKVVGSDPVSAMGGRRVMFVGPTGVGKTTTIAKLAAVHSLWEGRRVALATADTYRIAAVEQLRTYAKILGIPMEVAFEPKDFEGILSKHGSCDLLLLDTAGRSAKDSKKMEELKVLYDAFMPDAVHLVLAANLKYKDMLKVIDRMGVVPIRSVIFTKLDETYSFGPLLSVLEDFKFPVSFFTVGQNVPNDIEVARPERLVRLILEGDGLG